MIFITPAIASDPYCAEASRKISTLSIASVGIAEISAPVSPRQETFAYTQEKLMFFTFTVNQDQSSTCSLFFHRDLKEVASFTGVCTVLNDGILYCNASNVACPVELNLL
jgi:hypothetical protein